jgi:hypothetical protein
MLKLKYWLNALAMSSTTLRKQIAKNGRELMRMIRENEWQKKRKPEAVMRSEVTFVH